MQIFVRNAAQLLALDVNHDDAIQNVYVCHNLRYAERMLYMTMSFRNMLHKSLVVP